MHRIVYTSSSTRLMSEKRLQELLAVSRRNNQRDGISGLLIYHEGCFLQILEGPSNKISACYERIARDPTHHTPIRMIHEATPTRIFADWKMAYWSHEQLSGVQQRQFRDIRHLAEAAETVDLIDHPTVGTILMAFLSGFRDLDIAV